MVILKYNKSVSFTVLTGIVMVAWQILVGPLNYRFQILLFIGSIFSLGIPHGAFDYLVEQEVFRRHGAIFRGYIFRLKYLAAIIIYGAFWYYLPQISLVVFLLMSSWHFGETDLKQIMSWPMVSLLVRLIYGISVLLWIIFAHSTESLTVILHLLPAGSYMLKLWTVAFIHPEIFLLISGFTLTATLTFDHLKRKNNQRTLLLSQLLIILICCYFLPLLPAFALYFVGWHSVITLMNIKKIINNDIRVGKTLTMLKLILKALPASVVAIGALLLTGFLFKRYAPVFDPLPLLFVFLSLITLPHMQVMNKMNQYLKLVDQHAPVNHN